MKKIRLSELYTEVDTKYRKEQRIVREIVKGFLRLILISDVNSELVLDEFKIENLGDGFFKINIDKASVLSELNTLLGVENE